MAREALSMANDPRPQPLCVPEILREAFKIPKRNGKLMASVFLLQLPPYFFIIWVGDRSIGPLIDDDGDEGEDFAGRRGLPRLLFLESFFILALSAVSLLAMAMTMYATSVTYAGHHLTLKDTILRTLASWKKPTKTALCVAALTAAYASLLLILVGALSLVASGDALTAAVVLLGSSGAALYAFLAVIWTLGFAVSIIEDDCCGMDALARAAKLVKGRKIDGFLLMLLMLLLGAPISMLLFLNTREDDQGVAVRVAVEVAGTAAACLLTMFTFTAFTVFYHDCSRYHGDKVVGGAGYRQLSNSVHATSVLP